MDVAMDVTKPYKFIGFGAMDVTEPYKFIGFGAMDVAMDVTKPDRTLKTAGFSKENTFGPSFGRILAGKASKSASGRPSAGRRPMLKLSPIEFSQNSTQKCLPY